MEYENSKNMSADGRRKINEPDPDYATNVDFLKSVLALSGVKPIITFKKEEFFVPNPSNCEFPGRMCQDCQIISTCHYDHFIYPDKIFAKYDGLHKNKDDTYDALTSISFGKYNKEKRCVSYVIISLHQEHNKFVNELENYFKIHQRMYNET
jgi:hypothetical protein